MYGSLIAVRCTYHTQEQVMMLNYNSWFIKSTWFLHKNGIIMEHNDPRLYDDDNDDETAKLASTLNKCVPVTIKSPNVCCDCTFFKLIMKVVFMFILVIGFCKRDPGNAKFQDALKIHVLPMVLYSIMKVHKQLITLCKWTVISTMFTLDLMHPRLQHLKAKSALSSGVIHIA